ncbi:MAG: SbcC/MukB-like Walker B domain-containing protein, partial [Spirosomataceae bacterium]
IRVWFTECRNLEANKKTIKQEATQVHTLGNEQIQLIVQMGAELSPNFTAETPIHAATVDKIRDLFRTSLHQKEGILAELEAQLQQERVKEKLHSFAQQLQAGEPCLLCGSTHHPTKIEPSSQSVSVLENAVKQEKNKQEKLRESQQKFELAVSKWQDTEKQKEVIREKWEVALRLLNEQKETFIWETIPSVENDFNAWVETHMQLVAEHKQTTESMSVLQSNIEQKAAVIQQIEATKLKEIDQKVVAARTEIQVLEQQMVMENIASFAEKSVSELTTVIKQKEEEIKHIEDQAQQLEKDYQSLLQDVETQKGILAERTKEVTQRKQDIHSIQEQIDETLQHTPEFANEVDVRQMWQTWTLEELKKAQQEVQTFFTQIKIAQADLDEVQTKKQQFFGDLIYDAQKQTQLNETLGKAKAEQEQLFQTKGRLESQIQTLTEQLDKKSTLLQELALIVKRGDDLKILETMFRSSGFVNYISKIYLENLCRVANERFSRMTRQQLELTLGDDNTFWVRDMLNGGHLRLLKTLSGGQKFQAALSLALALADSIHSQQKMANNFFFIDEGFGSLDKGSLQIVFEALKSLRRENRIVGVISHVEELQQEIQTYLSISNTEEGSRIITSWEAS